MRINTLKDFINVLKSWKRNEGQGRPSLADLALVYVWNYVPDEVMIDAIAYYKYENVSSELYPTDLNDWKNKVLFKNKNNVAFTCMLVKVCPKTVKWKYDVRNCIYKKNDFINDMPDLEFAIETDEGEHIVINKTNINDYI